MKMSLWITHHTTATSNHDSAWWEEILTFYLHFQQASVYNFSGWVVMWMSMLPCVFPAWAQLWQCYLQCSATNSISKPRPKLLGKWRYLSYFCIFFRKLIFLSLQLNINVAYMPLLISQAATFIVVPLVAILMSLWFFGSKACL